MVNGISSERKVEKNLGHPTEYTEGPLGDVLGTSRINLPGTSLKRQIRTSPGRPFRTSPGRSNRIFRGRSGDVGEWRPRDVVGANICQLGCIFLLTKERPAEAFVTLKINCCKIVQKNKLCHSKQQEIGYLMIYDVI